MIRVNVLYPKTEGGTFDMKYYLEKHIPMIRTKFGAACTAVTVEQGLAGAAAGAPAAYVVLAHLAFDSVEAFGAAFGPNAEAIMSDIPNYTNIEPVIQLSEVKL